MKGISSYRSKKPTVYLLFLPLIMLLTLACASSALAEDQIVTLSPTISTQDTGSSFILTATYDVSDNDTSLTTIGIRFHYDSTKLQFDGFSDWFTTNFLGQQVAAGDWHTVGLKADGTVVAVG